MEWNGINYKYKDLDEHQLQQTDNPESFMKCHVDLLTGKRFEILLDCNRLLGHNNRHGRYFDALSLSPEKMHPDCHNRRRT